MTRGVLVLGGGVAGVQAALDLADAGVRVYLVEKSPSLGGNMIRLDKTFPTNDCSACILSPRLVEAGRHPRITLLTNSDLVSLEGDAPAFKARIVERPRFVDMDRCVACGECTTKCPSKVPSEFDMGLTKRKAVYIPFPQAVPLKYVIDPEHCLKLTKDKCGVCEKVCQANAINYDLKPIEHVLDVGAVVNATGYEQVDATARSEMGYGRFPDVITGMELERMLSSSGPTEGKVLRPSDGEVPGRVVYIHCVLSRDPRRGVPHCSRVCCMYLVKEAMIAREHHRDMDATMVHMDLRAYGKGYDRYLERAEEDGIKFVRGRAAEVRSRDDGSLAVIAEDGEGLIQEIPADMVVLGVALKPSPGTSELARTLGTKVDESGFFASDPSDPSGVRSSRTGVFLAGCSQGPKDVPDSVAQASAAASAALEQVKDDREEIAIPEVPYTDPEAEPRIGVFVCHCGSNIAGVVDCAAVAEHARALPGVVHAEENVYTCSQDAQHAMAETIQREGLNRVVVAACSPSTHEPLFASTLMSSGLNPKLIDMANIRNQCSWAHAAVPEAATEKSKDLVRASVARAHELEPLGGGTVEVPPTALVVGGGVAGMAAAIALAPHASVNLIERTDRLGGRPRELATTFPKGEPGSDIADRLEKAVRDAGVNILTGTELEDIEGYVGNFVYKYRTGEDDVQEATSSVLVLAMGSQPYEPVEGEFGWGASSVMTNLQLEEHMAKPPKGETIAFIQCVGSRNEERGCSRYCCQATLQQARELAEAGNRVIVLYRDIRAYASAGEDAYREAREAGVLFARYEAELPPEVIDGGSALRWRDLLARHDVQRKVDRVVLAVGLRPSASISDVRGILRLPGDSEGFLLERHPKLGPVETNTEGIYLAGTCQAPMNITEAAIAGAAAAMKAMVPLGKGWMAMGTNTSEINRDTCIGCNLCVNLCPYHAISKDDENKATVNRALCEGCGLCAASCPTQSISVRHFRDHQLRAQLHALVGGDAQ